MARPLITRHPMEWALDSLSQTQAAERAEPDTAFTVSHITMADLGLSLRRGFADFTVGRTDAVLLCIIYPVIGLLLERLMVGQGVLPLVFPLVAGFALLGPLLATGLYQMSRRMERGEPTDWADAFSAFRSPAIGSMVLLGLVLLAIFVVWLVAAGLIYDATLGPLPPASVGAFAHDLFGTGRGLALIVVGIGVGALFAAVTLAISVVSFPLLLDRNVGVALAIRTSFEAVRRNPVTLAAWGLVVSAVLLLGCLPFLVGLAIAMPVLGHATWHLYRRVIRPT